MTCTNNSWPISRQANVWQPKSVTTAETSRNGVIDGKMDFWYENTESSTQGYSSSTTFFSVYDGTVTSEREDLAADSQVVIDVPTARYCKTITVTASGTAALERTVIPDVRSYAGQTVVVSLYLATDVAGNRAIELCQDFGTAGSARVTGIGSQIIAVSGTFARYQVEIDVPSILGKTIDEDSYLEINIWLTQDGTYNVRAANLENQTGTTSLACVQIESGNVASKFEDLAKKSSLEALSGVYQTSYMEGAIGSNSVEGLQSHVLSSAATFSLQVTTQLGEMIAPPVVTSYSTDGTAGQLSKFNSSGTETSTGSVAASYISTKSFRLTAAMSSEAGVKFHYVADSRLGDITI